MSRRINGGDRMSEITFDKVIENAVNQKKRTLRCKVDETRDLDYVLKLCSHPEANFTAKIVPDGKKTHLRFEIGGVYIGKISGWNLRYMVHRLGMQLIKKAPRQKLQKK